MGYETETAMSKPAMEMPIPLKSRITRGLTPAKPQEWAIQNEDPATVLTRNLGQWLKDVSFNEEMFKKHVHSNDNLSDLDLLQHRARLCGLIADGEWIVRDVTVFTDEIGGADEAKPMISLVNERLKKLFAELFSWHAPLASQTDIPESFKQAAREVEEGKVVDLDI